MCKCYFRHSLHIRRINIFILYLLKNATKSYMTKLIDTSHRQNGRMVMWVHFHGVAFSMAARNMWDVRASASNAKRAHLQSFIKRQLFAHHVSRMCLHWYNTHRTCGKTSFAFRHQIWCHSAISNVYSLSLSLSLCIHYFSPHNPFHAFSLRFALCLKSSRVCILFALSTY